MKKKILFIGTRPIYPMKDGRTVLINQYCGQFVDYFHDEVYYACFGALKMKQPDYLKATYALEEPGLWEMGKNIVCMTFLARKWPIQTSVMYSAKTQRKLDDIIEKVRPDYIFCDMARTAPYLHKRYGKDCVKILDMDDLLSKRYYRQAEMENLDDSVLGQIRNRIPDLFISVVAKWKLMKKLLRFEARMMEKYELQVVKEFDKVFFCSATDKEEFNRKSSYQADCVHVAVDLEYFHRPEGREYDAKTIVYLGNIDIAANRDTLFYLAEKIMCKLLKRDSAYKLLVVGNCSQETYQKFRHYHFIEFSFRVDDIRPFVQSCVALAAPIQYGSGIKIKIIEAMAMGVPVITNQYGVEGLDVHSDQELMVCETDEQFVDAIMEISGNEQRHGLIAAKGREYVEKNHSLEVCVRDLERVLNR